MSENNNQKSRVAQLALRSAMSSIGAVEQPEFVEFALGAGAVSANHAWVVVLEQCERSLGPVLLWAQSLMPRLSTSSLRLMRVLCRGAHSCLIEIFVCGLLPTNKSLAPNPIL